MSELPKSQRIAELLDARPAASAQANAIALERQFTMDSLAPRYIEAFPLVRRYPGRMCMLFRLVGYARQNSAVVDLSLNALNDSSRIVRYHACAALAFSLRKDVVPSLRNALKTAAPDTQLHLAAAIDAIESQNHHLFADRDHKGNVFWHPDGYPSAVKHLVGAQP